MASITLQGPTVVASGATASYKGVLYPDQPLISGINNIAGAWIDGVYYKDVIIYTSNNRFDLTVQWGPGGPHELLVVWRPPPVGRSNGSIDSAYTFSRKNIAPVAIKSVVQYAAGQYGSKYAFATRNYDTRQYYACIVDSTTLGASFIPIPGGDLYFVVMGDGEFWTFIDTRSLGFKLRRYALDGTLLQEWTMSGSTVSSPAMSAIGMVRLPSGAIVCCWFQAGTQYHAFFSYLPYPYTGIPTVLEVDFGAGATTSGEGSLAVHPDGSIWMFEHDDGGNHLNAIHLSEVNGALLFDWAEPEFNGDHDCPYYRIHGELPRIVSCPWAERNTLALGFVVASPIEHGRPVVWNGTTYYLWLAQPCITLVDSDRRTPRSYLKLDRSAIDVWQERTAPVVPNVINGELWMFTSYVDFATLTHQANLIKWNKTIEGWGVPNAATNTGRGANAVALHGFGWVIGDVDGLYLVHSPTVDRSYTYQDGYWV